MHTLRHIDPNIGRTFTITLATCPTFGGGSISRYLFFKKNIVYSLRIDKGYIEEKRKGSKENMIFYDPSPEGRKLYFLSCQT